MKTPANLASRRHPDRLTTRAHQHGRRLARRTRRFIKTGHPRGCDAKATRCLHCTYRLRTEATRKRGRRVERNRRVALGLYWPPGSSRLDGAT